VFSNDPTKRPGPENKPSVGEKERINNNAAMIMSLAPKVYPAYVFLWKCSREDFSQTLSVCTTTVEVNKKDQAAVFSLRHYFCQSAVLKEQQRLWLSERTISKMTLEVPCVL